MRRTCTLPLVLLLLSLSLACAARHEAPRAAESASTFFAQPALDDPRAAAVLKRLLNGDDPVTASRTCGFTRDGAGLVAERISGTLDEDRDMRAAPAQALGQLRVVGAQGLLATRTRPCASRC